MPEPAKAINAYRCQKCGLNTVTINGVEGTTPFMIECRANWPGGTCDGLAQSSMYRVAPDANPQWEWYKPEGADLERLIAQEYGWKDHVQRGGLALRRLTGLRRSELMGSPRSG